VTINGQEIINWSMFKFPFTNVSNVKYSDKIYKNSPGLYKGYFNLSRLGDTYLDMRPFGKGFVFLNGHNLGKYWNIGPTQTIYIPACWLKKRQNEIIVFDQLKNGHLSVSVLNNPILGSSSK